MIVLYSNLLWECAVKFTVLLPLLRLQSYSPGQYEALRFLMSFPPQLKIGWKLGQKHETVIIGRINHRTTEQASFYNQHTDVFLGQNRRQSQHGKSAKSWPIFTPRATDNLA
jgi:hypothetical protein